MLTLCFMNHLFIFHLFGLVHCLDTIVIIYLFRVCLKGFVQNQEDYLHFYFHIIIRSFKFLCLYRLHPTSYQASTCHLYVWHTNVHVIVFTVYINAVFVCID